MVSSRRKLIFQNVAPAILSNACVFLFSVIDGIFVGNGAGSQALGAVNIALPFVCKRYIIGTNFQPARFMR